MITGSLKLSALKNVEVEMPRKDGTKVKGLFIPYEANKLEKHSNGEVYLNIVAWENKTPQTFSTHMVKQSLKKEEREKMTKEEVEAMPILGNLNANSQPAANINTDESINTDSVVAPVDDNDPLPF